MRARNGYLWVLLAVILSASFYFSVRFAGAWMDYFPLQATARGQITQWEIEEKEDQFFVQANYLFGGERGSYRFKKKYFSEAAAFAALKEKARQDWIVWYNPAKPDRSALEREFPYNLLFRMSICYGISIYFVLLIRKIRKIEM